MKPFLVCVQAEGEHDKQVGKGGERGGRAVVRTSETLCNVWQWSLVL